MRKKHGAKGGVNIPALPRTFMDELPTWVQRKAPRDGRVKKIQPNKQRFG